MNPFIRVASKSVSSLRNRRQWTAFQKYLSVDSTSDESRKKNEELLASHRRTIFKLALSNVHSHGWTEDAVMEAVESMNLPLTLSGLVFPIDRKPSGSSLDAALIHSFMQDCNSALRRSLESVPVSAEEMDSSSISADIQSRLFFALKSRLEMNTPFVKSKRWHEAMAIGSLPHNALPTARHLEEFVNIVMEDLHAKFGKDQFERYCDGYLHRKAIGGVYVATELYLLTDESKDFADTWSFLDSRIKELDSIAKTLNEGVGSGEGISLNESLFAATAVATSLGSGVMSLGQPVAKGIVSAVAEGALPMIMNLLQQPSSSHVPGSHASDYKTVNEKKTSLEKNMKAPLNAMQNRTFTSSTSTTPDFVQSTINENRVAIFSKTYCPYCSASKSLFSELNVDTFICELDATENGNDIQDYLLNLTGQRTVPSIFINGQHVGGNSDVQAAHSDGRLSKLLDL
mmetsp:Transcript_11495/g.14986  ORF Transcript_11495/g.14986 Transcript_11495/m.14986 type:complete len:458 (-) Transcript_11495:37-1410(-)